MRQFFWRFCFLLLILLLVVNTSRSESRQNAQFSWRQTSSSLALLNHEQIVWQFNHLGDGVEKGCPFFHPLATLDGAVLTDLRPDDHVWHRGLRFAWKKINGLEGYWTWPDGQERWPDKIMGRTEVLFVKTIPREDYSAHFELELSYHPPGKPPVLKETRIISVSAPDRRGNYQIDWQGVFTAGKQDVLLDRTPIPGEEGGKQWGGYAGMQFRVSHRTNLAGWAILTSEGVEIKNTIEQKQGLELAHGKGARWLNLTLDFSNGKTGGVTLFGHPGNLRHPAPWHVSSMPNELIHTPLYASPYKLEAGKTLTLQHRIIIHPGRVDRNILENQWTDFAR